MNKINGFFLLLLLLLFFYLSIYRTLFLFVVNHFNYSIAAHANDSNESYISAVGKSCIAFKSSLSSLTIGLTYDVAQSSLVPRP